MAVHGDTARALLHASALAKPGACNLRLNKPELPREKPFLHESRDTVLTEGNSAFCKIELHTKRGPAGSEGRTDHCWRGLECGLEVENDDY